VGNAESRALLAAGVDPRRSRLAHHSVRYVWPAEQGRVRLAVGLVVEPSADNQAHELGLAPEAQAGVEGGSIVGLESDVLARQVLLEAVDHRRRDSLPAHR